MCLDGRVVQQANLPEPAMLLEQVYDSIVGAGVRLVRCEGEADLELARACATFVRRGWPAYVLANDSDFLLMADVQYVPLSELSTAAATEKARLAARLAARPLLSRRQPS